MKTQKTIMQQVGLMLAVAVMLLILVPGTVLAQTSKSRAVSAIEKKGTVSQESNSQAQPVNERKFQAPVAKEIKASAEKIAMLKNFKVVLENMPQMDPLNQAELEAAAKAAIPKLPEVVRVKKINGKVPRGVLYLGKGYNVHTGEYADAESLTPSHVLDIDALIEDGHIGLENISNDYYRYTAESSISKYSKSTATSVGLSGNYGFFKGSVNAAWNSSQQGEYGRDFASIMYKLTLYRVYINPAVDLKYYLSKAYKNDLKLAADGNSYGNLISRYGTHVLCYAIMGGKFDYFVSTDYSYDLSTSSSQVDVEAGFNSGFASANVSVGNRSTSMSSEYKRSKEERYIRKPSLSETGGSEATWVKNLAEKAALIDFQEKSTTSSTSLKLLYEVSKGAVIYGTNGQPTFTYNDNSKYKAAYESYANGTLYPDPKSYPEIDNCITGLALQASTQGGWETLQPTLDSDGKSWWKPIGPIGGKRDNYYSNETRYVLFARFGRSSASRPPIVYITLQKQGLTFALQGLNITSFNLPDGTGPQAYYVPLKGQTPKKTNAIQSKDAVHFNVGGGTAQRGDDLVLLYVASPWLSSSIKPIMQLRFSVRDNHPIYYYPKDTKALASFSSILHNGQEWDTGDNWQNYKGKSNDKYPNVYGQNYLQYSYEPAK